VQQEKGRQRRGRQKSPKEGLYESRQDERKNIRGKTKKKGAFMTLNAKTRPGWRFQKPRSRGLGKRLPRRQHPTLKGNAVGYNPGRF